MARRKPAPAKKVQLGYSSQAHGLVTKKEHEKLAKPEPHQDVETKFWIVTKEEKWQGGRRRYLLQLRVAPGSPEWQNGIQLGSLELAVNKTIFSFAQVGQLVTLKLRLGDQMLPVQGSKELSQKGAKRLGKRHVPDRAWDLSGLHH